jgi:hypothetical protein
MAGVFAKTVILPLDLVRKRQQIQGPLRNSLVIHNIPKYSEGVFRTLTQIIRHEGFLSLYKGVVPSLLKSGLSSAVTFLVVSNCQAYFQSLSEGRSEDPAK